MKSRTKRLAAVAAAAVSLSALTPASPALAINAVGCYDPNFVRLQENYSRDYCFANAGTYSFALVRTVWVSRISTGNNDLDWMADNRWNFLPRHHVLTFPRVGTVKVQEIRIR